MRLVKPTETKPLKPTNSCNWCLHRMQPCLVTPPSQHLAKRDHDQGERENQKEEREYLSSERECLSSEREQDQRETERREKIEETWNKIDVRNKKMVFMFTFMLQWVVIVKLFSHIKIYIVGSQIVAHTQMETGDGPNKPNTINL